MNSNKKYPISKVLNFALPLIQFLNKSKIEYLIYGSVAQNLHQNNLQARVGDLDIIITEKDFEEIVNSEELQNHYNQIVQEKNSVFINEQEFTPDTPTMSISLDSYEHYFANEGFSLQDFVEFKYGKTEVKLLSEDLLAQIYIKHYV